MSTENSPNNPRRFHVDDYYFTLLHVDSNNKFNAEKPYDNKFNLEVNSKQVSADVVGVEVSLTTAEQEGEPPYLVEIKALSFVRADGEFDSPELKEKHAAAFAAQILLGSIREQMYTMMLRGPWRANTTPLDICSVNDIMSRHVSHTEPEESTDKEPAS